MAKSVLDYVKDIKKILRDHKTYTAALDPQITSLASAMRNLQMANDQIDTLVDTTVWKETRTGRELVPHPVFKISKDAQRSITEQMKALNLTVDELAGEADDDPLADLTKKLTKRRKAATIITPKD